jgi:DNA-binding MarR family transcriptional regulator
VKRLYLTKKGWDLRPDMERIGYRLNALLLNDFDDDEIALAMRNLKKIALNASEL